MAVKAKAEKQALKGKKDALKATIEAERKAEQEEEMKRKFESAYDRVRTVIEEAAKEGNMRIKLKWRDELQKEFTTFLLQTDSNQFRNMTEKRLEEDDFQVIRHFYENSTTVSWAV